MWLKLTANALKHVNIRESPDTNKKKKKNS